MPVKRFSVCPYDGTKIVKRGTITTRKGIYQRYMCRRGHMLKGEYIKLFSDSTPRRKSKY